jgi:hypothetical protein
MSCKGSALYEDLVKRLDAFWIMTRSYGQATSSKTTSRADSEVGGHPRICEHVTPERYTRKYLTRQRWVTFQISP